MRNNPLLFKQSTTIQVQTNSAGKFFLGVNFNGAPQQSDITKSILVYTQDSALNPVTYSDFQGFNLAFGTGLGGMWAQMRLAAIKLRFIPYHPQDDSSIMVQGNWYMKSDYDGEEKSLTNWVEEDFMKTGFKLLPTTRQWKMYKKSFKYRMSNKYPAPNPNVTPNNNQNHAGQWHGVGDSLGKSNDVFGTHLQFLLINGTVQYIYGKIVATGYFVLKDRY